MEYEACLHFVWIMKRKIKQMVNNFTNMKYLSQLSSLWNRIGGVMVSVLATSVVDRVFEPRSGQTKDYKIGICCFSAKHVALRRKSKDWLARNQNNVFEWNDMSTLGLFFQWASTIKIQLGVLV
jgi:hypothetical protein